MPKVKNASKDDAPKKAAPKQQPKADAPPAVRAPAPRGDDVTEAYIPDTQVATRQDLPGVEASPRFQYMAHPEKWTVLEGQVVPSLAKFKLKGGVNGVEHKHTPDGKDRFIYRSVRAEFEEQGWQFIPWDVDGPNTSYMRKVKGREDVFLSAWERVYPGSGHIESDTQGYVAFCRRLVDSGVIKSAPVYVLARMRDQYRKQRDRALKLARADERYGRKADLLEQKLDAVEAELQRIQAGAAPAETEPAAPPAEEA